MKTQRFDGAGMGNVHVAGRLRRIGRARVWISIAGALAAAAAAYGQTPLAPPDLPSFSEFGSSAAMRDNWLLIGAPGTAAVHAYELGDGTVVHQGILQPSVQSQSMKFGSALAFDGSSAVVGAYRANHESIHQCGAAYVFDRVGTGWIERGKLTASDAASSTSFGYSVAMDGNLILVGASWREQNGINCGAVYSFRRAGDTFVEEAILVPPDGAAGDRFGFSVALSGEWGFVSAPYHNPPDGAARGAVYIFRRLSGAWQFVAKLTNTPDERSSGGPLAVEGGLLLVGTVGDSVAHAFRLEGETWVREYFFNPAGVYPSSLFGEAVALHNNRAVFGNSGSPFRGSAYVYEREDGDWILHGVYDVSNGEGRLGRVCALWGSRFVLGAPLLNVPAYHSGQAYLFDDNSMPPSMASDPFPADTAWYVEFDTVMTWTNGIETGTVDLLLDTVSPPVTKLLDNVPAVESFALSALPLEYDRQYYWRVICRNEHGETGGPIWRFRTRLEPPEFGLTGDPLDFGDVPINTTSDPATLTIHNTGPSSMIGRITPPPRYAVSIVNVIPPKHYDAGAVVNFWMPPNATRVVEIRFQPLEAGDHAGVLTITSNDPDHSGTSLPVSGFGLPPAPGAPHTPAPAHGATNVSITPRLTWSNGSDTATVDVYFGRSEDPPKVLDGVSAREIYDPGRLAYGADYWWRVVCHNAGGSATGPLWRFTTRPEPVSITVVAPNGGERWPAGTEQFIRWDPGESGSAVHIILLREIGKDGFERVATLVEEAPNTGIWAWPIPIDFERGEYFVEVTDAVNPMLSDRSDAAFRIEVGAWLRVTSPNGGESWAMGERHDVTWTSLRAGERLAIHLYTTINGYTQFIETVATGVPNTGLYTWEVPTGHRPGNFYLIMIEDEDNPAVNDFSDAEFALTRRPSITVDAPMEGARWPLETEQVVTWRSMDVSSHVRIQLSRDGKPVGVLAAAIPDTGRFVWRIAEDLALSDLYQIEVADAADETVFGRSARFELTEPPIVITVSQPGDGQRVQLGARQEVLWTSRHAGPRVVIELWAEGRFLHRLQADVPNEGRWGWDVHPGLGPMDNCQIRVVDAAQPDSFGFSGVFALVEPPTITVLQPNGGERWLVGSRQEVVWTIAGEVDYVRIDIYRDDEFLETIAPVVPNTGSFDWTIADAYGRDRNRLRISDADADWVTDFSDDVFELIEPPPEPPTKPWPRDGELDVPWMALLEWRNGAYTATTDVYLDVLNPPVERVAQGLPAGAPFHLTNRLQPATRYYWRVVNKNASGSSKGPVWSFETEWQTFRMINVQRHAEGLWLEWAPVRGALHYRVLATHALDKDFKELDTAPGNGYLHVGAFEYPRLFYRVEPVMD